MIVNALRQRLLTKRYRVQLEGDGLWVMTSAGVMQGGFVSTRFVDAQNETLAREDALASIHAESLWQNLPSEIEATAWLAEADHPETSIFFRKDVAANEPLFKVAVTEVTKVGWFTRRFRPQRGYTFYTFEQENPMDESHME